MNSRYLRVEEVVVFLTLWFTFAYFAHREPGWNVNSRLALTYAIVERGTVCIDDYWNKPDTQTHDVAVVGGHYYSDKIIGTSMLGVPAFAAVRAIEARRGHRFPPIVRRYLVNLFSTALVSALAGVVFLRLVRRYSAELSIRGSFWYTVVLTFMVFCGTMLGPFAGLFLSYGPGVCFLLVALALIEGRIAQVAVPADTQNPANKLPLDIWSNFSVGLALGAAILFEYLAGWAALLLAIYYLRWNRSLRAAAAIMIGAAIALAPFFLYTVSVFGRFAIPYQYEMEAMFRDGMAQGLMGATWPRLDVLYLLTFHPYRGLFLHAPQLLIGVVGFACWWRVGARLRSAIFCAIAAGYLAYNSGYYMWWGGWSFAPRHLAFAVPFLGLACMPTLRWLWARVTLLVAGSWGVLVHTIVAAVEPQFPDRCFGLLKLDDLLDPDLSRVEYPWVFGQYVWKLFWHGEMEPNLGTLLGLRGPASLLPLLIGWGTAFFVLGFAHRLSAQRSIELEAR